MLFIKTKMHIFGLGSCFRMLAVILVPDFRRFDLSVVSQVIRVLRCGFTYNRV